MGQLPYTCNTDHTVCINFQVEPTSHETPVAPGMLRFVCLSDTHTKYPTKVPAGDVLLHAGDFTNVGLAPEVKAFNDYLSEFY